ncbi:hypothetical protein HAX54_034107 [Datura stramonium]|uniref:Uncharacterized protein n=1 Tax=Datura stramonium TaxID=4076 RepID=A0ABS8VDJ9_DATST|nr:hypothetical protein [Datura stramonium]
MVQRDGCSFPAKNCKLEKAMLWYKGIDYHPHSENNKLEKVILRCKAVDTRSGPKNGKLKKVILQCKGMDIDFHLKKGKIEKIILWRKGLDTLSHPKKDLRFQLMELEDMKTLNCGFNDFELQLVDMVDLVLPLEDFNLKMWWI